MLPSKLRKIPQCEDCVYYVKRPNEVPRCRLVSMKDKNTGDVDFALCEVVRRDDVELCGRFGSYFVKKK